MDIGRLMYPLFIAVIDAIEAFPNNLTSRFHFRLSWLGTRYRPTCHPCRASDANSIFLAAKRQADVVDERKELVAPQDIVCKAFWSLSSEALGPKKPF